MSEQAIETYVRGERERGVSDEAIRAELLRGGWKEEDITMVMGVAVSRDLPRGLAGKRWGAQPWVVWVGFAMMCVSSLALLLLGPKAGLRSLGISGVFEFSPIIFGLFTFTHVANSASALLVFTAVSALSPRVWWKVLVWILAIPIAVFAVFSTLHFFSITTGSDFFDVFRYLFPGSQVLNIVLYFILLPAQAVVFLALLSALGIMHALLRHRGVSSPVARPLVVALTLFFIIALIGVGNLALVLSGEHLLHVWR